MYFSSIDYHMYIDHKNNTFKPDKVTNATDIDYFINVILKQIINTRL